MPKNLMPVDAVCGNPLSVSQGCGSMLVAQEIRVSQFELEAHRVGRHGFAEASAAYEEPTHPEAPFGVGGGTFTFGVAGGGWSVMFAAFRFLVLGSFTLYVVW